MKKLFALILALLMLCACGKSDISTKLLPLEMSVKSADENKIVVSVKNIGEEKIKVDGTSLYKLEDKKEISFGYVRFLDYKTENEYIVLPGQTTEWTFDTEVFFEKLSEGEYKMTFGGFEVGDYYNGNWGKRLYFVIE